MKKNFIYALIACFTLSLAACSTDPEDATSKHVYGENENPYLKTNADAVVSTKAEFPISRLEAKTVKLTDYAEKFHTYLGMTVVWGIERSVFFNGREKWAKDFENQRV